MRGYHRDLRLGRAEKRVIPDSSNGVGCAWGARADNCFSSFFCGAEQERFTVVSKCLRGRGDVFFLCRSLVDVKCARYVFAVKWCDTMAANDATASKVKAGSNSPAFDPDKPDVLVPEVR